MHLKTLYGQYKYLYRNEKKQYNLQIDMHQLTYKQFKEIITQPKTNTIKKILDMQRQIKQDEKAKKWREYKRRLKTSPSLKHYKTFKAYMKDRHNFGVQIAERIKNGENRKDVLADYGYTE